VELLERDEQLAVLAAAHGEAATGRGCVVLLEGEPGIGKTALITRAAADVAGSTRVLWGSCDDLSPRLCRGACANGDCSSRRVVSPGWA
jgi:predicted ATPase